jgi:threonine dehydrogenase-like Zn-dependent dehydrogenase
MYADFYCVSPSEAVFKVPDTLPDECISFVNCAMGTVTEGLIQSGLEPGQSVVIFGAGGLGLCATGVAKCLGAGQVIVLDRQANRLELAKAFGAEVTINVDEVSGPDRIAHIRELTGRGADVVLELVGNKNILPEGVQMLAKGGTFVQMGAIDPTETVEIFPGTLYLGVRIMGSGMYQPQRIPMMLNMLERNRDRFPFDRIVSARYPLEDIDRAFADADWMTRGSTEITRAVLVP